MAVPLSRLLAGLAPVLSPLSAARAGTFAPSLLSLLAAALHREPTALGAISLAVALRTWADVALSASRTAAVVLLTAAAVATVSAVTSAPTLLFARTLDVRLVRFTAGRSGRWS